MNHGLNVTEPTINFEVTLAVRGRLEVSLDRASLQVDDDHVRRGEVRVDVVQRTFGKA